MLRRGVYGAVLTGSVAGGPASPPLSGDIAAFWRMDEYGTIADTGGLVDQVNDLSGNGHHLTGTTTTRPVYEAVNGKGQVRFNGAKNLAIPVSLTVDRRNVSIFAVVRRGAGVATMALVHFPTVATNLALYQITSTIRVFHSASINSSIEYGGHLSAGGVEKASGTDETEWMIGAAANAYIGMGQQTYTHGSALAAGTYSGGLIGEWNGAAFRFSGAMRAVLIYNRALSLAEKDDVLDYLESEFGAVGKATETFICADGDSLTQGVEASDEFNYHYPFQMSRIAASPFKLWNNGQGGAQLTTAANLAATTVLARLAGSSAYTNRVVIALWGTNDIANGRTDAQVIADINTYIANIRAGDAGAKILFITILPRVPFNGTQDGYIAGVNAHIISGAAHDGYIDAASDARLDDAADTTYYDPDGIHLNDAGYAVLAELVHAKVVAEGWL